MSDNGNKNGNGNGNGHGHATLFGEEEAARRIREKYNVPISARTLFRMRKKAKGLVPFFLIGGRVFYNDECCDALIENSKRCV